jgi:hypothetical protein
MRNGACRYGKNCRFNHPEHVVDAQFYAPTRWEDSTLGLKKSSNHHTTLDDTSYLQKSSDDATLDETSYSKKSSDHATLNATLYPEKSSDHATIDDTSTEVLPPNILRMLLPSQNVLPDTEGKMMQVKKVHIIPSLYYAMFRSVFAHIVWILLLFSHRTMYFSWIMTGGLSNNFLSNLLHVGFKLVIYFR